MHLSSEDFKFWLYFIASLVKMSYENQIIYNNDSTVLIPFGWAAEWYIVNHPLLIFPFVQDKHILAQVIDQQWKCLDLNMGFVCYSSIELCLMQHKPDLGKKLTIKESNSKYFWIPCALRQTNSVTETVFL